MKIISYSDVMYTLTVNNLKQKINHITSWPEEPEAGDSNVAAMLKFIDLYEKAGEMMREYKDLLAVDQQSLKEAGNTIELQDLAISKRWK